MNDTLPDALTEALDDYRNASTAKGLEKRASLVSAILVYARQERERGVTLPPEIVELLRDVASGPCMPDLRGRAGAALVRRDLAADCQRCGGSGYERIGDGSVNAWGACEVCRPAPSRSEGKGEADPGVRSYTVRICGQCRRLEGEMCHNPACVFCRRTTAEVGEVLDVLLLRPVVDGERLDLMGAPSSPQTTPAKENDRG